MVTKPMRIRLVYISPDYSHDQIYELAQGSTVEQLVLQSQLWTHWQAQHEAPVAIQSLALGIWGQSCQAEQVLQDLDRVEVYRPLSFDPMESRRRRHAHKLSQKPLRPRRRRAPVQAG